MESSEKLTGIVSALRDAINVTAISHNVQINYSIDVKNEDQQDFIIFDVKSSSIDFKSNVIDVLQNKINYLKAIGHYGCYDMGKLINDLESNTNPDISNLVFDMYALEVYFSGEAYNFLMSIYNILHSMQKHNQNIKTGYWESNYYFRFVIQK